MARSERPVALVTWLLAGWIAATVLAQHPQHEFDRMRRIPVFRLVLPDWRFFVPSPPDHDLVPIFRRVVDGEPGRWSRIGRPRERNLLDGLWFPGARREHGLVDVSRELSLLGPVSQAELDSCVPFVVLREAVRAAHGVDGHEVQIGILAERPYASDTGRRIMWLSPAVRM
ncbi:hypothetical protein [Microbacterium aurugineum]